MHSFSGLMKKFRREDDGVVAIIFAIAALPIFGLVGGAVDYNQALSERSKLQGALDAAAVAGAKVGATTSTGVLAETQKHFNATVAADVRQYPITITQDAAAKTVTITAGGKMDTTFLRLVGLTTLDVNAKVTAVGRLRTSVTTNTPQTMSLDYEAGDYNRLYIYCFDKNRTNQPDRGRTQMTPLADNGGTKYQVAMPQCREGETMSLRLYNVRNARTQPQLWDTTNLATLIPNNTADPWRGNERYEYFTDTTSTTNNILTQNVANNVPILETVLCNSLAECKPRSQGGIIPEGKNRTPQQATGQCSPGKFMYYGWEDRPAGYGWTDRDFDDIRIVIECPRTVVNSTLEVRIIE